MHNIHLLSRIFEEELHLIASHFFNTTTYQDYLKSYDSNLSTHYTLQLKIDSTGKISLVSHQETPFHHKTLRNSKEDYINLLEDLDHKSTLAFIQEEFKESGLIFKQALMSNNTDLNEIDHQHITVELLVNLPFETIPEDTMAYYYYHKLMEHIRKETLLAIQKLYFDPLKTENERTILIRKYQNKISYYLSVLELNFSKLYQSSNIQVISLNKKLEDSFKCIHLNLEKILCYMEHCLYDYMDKEQPISYLQRKQFINLHYSSAEELITLIKLRELPEDIEFSICKPLVAIVNNKLEAYSYQRRDYCATYISVFRALLKKAVSFNHDDIYKLLITLNYNNHNVFKALEREFLVELDKYDKIKDKQNYLYTKLAKVNRIAVTAPFKYHIDFPGLKEHLIKFINEMLKLYEQQEELVSNEIPSLENQNTLIKVPTIKRKVNTTVHELALLTRLLFECGITPLERSKQQHFKFIATHYSTKDTKQFSEHNIKNSFYSPKQNSFEPIEKLLITMLSKLQKLKNSCTTKRAYS